jgi:hypothetical protein
VTSPVSGDLLSAASLLTTVISLLYSTWYGEIKDARNIQIPLHDRDPIIRTVRTVLWSRADPLLFAAVLLGAILTPTFVDVIHYDWNVLTGRSTHWHYDPVQACFIAVFFVILILVALTASAAWRLTRVLKKLRAAKNPRSSAS